ncbi:hypothetical protein [Micromonospora nigra]|uniref:hypothetical protein n=1 Tax=Micromonospora nigra TaxID=145857 RepID=UPI001FDF279D|nr:hypothetical protein [Micromonospora nigra]
MRLARHARAAHEMSWRRGMLLDPVAVEILAHRDPSTVLHLRRSRVSSAVVRRIAADSDARIRDAHLDFVRSMIERAVSLPIDDLEEALGRPRALLAADPDPAVRAAVADAWWERPADVHVALLTDAVPAVRAAAVRRGHPSVPMDLQPRCLADPATRAHVARYAQLTPALGMDLAMDPDEEVRQAAARNPALPAEAVARLVADADPGVRGNIAQHRLVDTQTRDRLYAQLTEESKAGSVEAQVALEWNFLEPDWVCEEPPPDRLAYLESPHVVFRRALARSRDLPPEAWQRLDADCDWRVRRYAAMRPDVPPAVLERLVREHGDGGPFRPGMVEHPNFPREVLPTFTDAEDARVRRLALHDTNLPRPLLARLTADPDAHVRRAAAEHPGLDEELLQVLLTDGDADVVANAAASDALPVVWMYRILDGAGL